MTPQPADQPTSSPARDFAWLDAQPDCAFVLDGELRVVHVNRAMLDREGPHAPLLDVKRGVDPLLVACGLPGAARRALNGASPARAEGAVSARRRVRSLVYATGGFVVVQYHDVDSRADAEGAELERLQHDLRYERARFGRLLDIASNVVWRTGPNGEQIEGSTSWEAFTGQPAGESLNGGWLEMLHPDDREPTLRAWEAAQRGRGTYDVRYRLRRRDGEYRVMHVRAAPVVQGGEVREWVGLEVDVTEQVLAEQQLHSWGLELQKQVRERTEALQRTLDEQQATTDALTAFAAFVELAARESEREAIIEQAVAVIARTVPGSGAGFLVVQEDRWVLRSYAGDVLDETISAYREGVPDRLTDMTRAVLSGDTFFFDAWPPDASESLSRYASMALTPVGAHGETIGVIAVGLRRRGWTERDRAVVRSVARALDIAVASR